MKKTIWTFAVLGLLVAVGLATFVSPFASSSPDGLEKVANDKGFAQKAQEDGVWKWAPIPDYVLPGVKSEAVGTALAGLVGTLLVFVAALLIGRFVARRSPPSNGSAGGDGA